MKLFKFIWEEAGSAKDCQNLNDLTKSINDSVGTNDQFTKIFPWAFGNLTSSQRELSNRSIEASILSTVN